MSWTGGDMNRPNWKGSGVTGKTGFNSNVINVSSLNANSISTNYIYAANLSTNNGSIAFLSNLVLNTGVIGLGIGPTFLTANDGILYVNGDAVAFPSSLSTIADWSFFSAVSDVNMGRSSIYNVQSISTNTISTGTLLTRSISTTNLASGNVVTNNISSGIITYDTLTGRSGTVGTLTGNSLVYSNGVMSNFTSITANTGRITACNIIGTYDLRVPSISTIIVSSFLIEANTLYGQSTATGYLVANEISTGTLKAQNIYNVQEMVLSEIVVVPDWSSIIFYNQGTLLKYNGLYYRSKVDNLNVVPNVLIPEWPGPATWSVGNCVWVNGLGTYRCLVGGYYQFSINGYPDQWVNIGAGNSPSLVWLQSATPIGENTGEIRGNDFSLVQVGRLSSMTLNTSSFNTNTITVNNLNVNTINSSNIVNSNSFSNAGNLTNTGNTQLNTLTTSGQVVTNNTLVLNGDMDLNSEIYGRTNSYPSYDGTQTQFFQSLHSILDIETNYLKVVGCGTGNGFNPFLPLRNNSIVDIGETEFSPAIVSIYGVNAGLTTALSVYGIASITGDTTINGLTTVNGITDLNGDCTVLGFLDVGGTLDVAGVTTITGATNIGGVLTVEGETNIAGALTAEAGIVAVGALGFTGGDITIGGEPATSPTNNFNFYNYYRNTNVEALTVNKNGDFRQDVGVAGNLNVGGIIFGTVVSGSETISTLNVSTLRAYNISSITNTTQEFFVSSIAGYSNRTIHVNNGMVIPSISTNSISTGSITLSNIVTNNISTNTLNMINGTTNQFLLRSYEGQGPILGFNRTIDGVDFLDAAIGTTDETGFIIAGFSTINVSAFNDISITSAENAIIKAENVNISTNIFFVDNAAGISSIYTNYIDSKLVDLYTQGTETPAAVVFYRDIDGERFGDGAIATNNEDGFQISAASTMKITTLDDMLITSVQGNIGLISDSNNIFLSAPETIIPYNLNVSSISTGYVIAGTLIATNGIGTTNVTTSNLFSDYTSTGSIYANSATIVNDLSANNLFTTNLLTYYIGNPLPFQSPVTFNDNLNISGNDIYNTFTLSASNISTNFLSTGSLLSGVITTPAISTTTISTSVLNTNSINAPVNINCGKSLIPFSGNNLDLGASGAFRWRNLWVSTISSIHTQTSTIATTQIAVDRIIGNASSNNIFTNNLFPTGAGAQLGYNSSGTPGGGFYNILAVRSTFTQVINPSGEAGRFSNAVYINTNLSTQNVMVSSINNKLYPYTSTLNIPFSSFSITGNQAGTPILLYSNVDFRTQGFHRISQKAILSKNSGGTSADIHANIFYSIGSFPSTPSITDGYSALPSVNQDNASTFTTLMTEFYVSTPTTRSIFYYDSTANNYTSRLFMGTLFDSVTPDFGNNVTRIPAIQ